jgi:hypothetical protein
VESASNRQVVQIRLPIAKVASDGDIKDPGEALSSTPRETYAPGASFRTAAGA